MNQEENFLKNFTLRLALWPSLSYSSLGLWHRLWSLDSVWESDAVSSSFSFLATDTCSEHRDLLCHLDSEVWTGSGLNLLKRQIFWNDYHYELWFLFPTWNMIRGNLQLPIFHYGLEIPSLGRGICQSQRTIYWQIWRVLLYVLELVPAQNFEYEMGNLSLETEILERI